MNCALALLLLLTSEAVAFRLPMRGNTPAVAAAACPVRISMGLLDMFKESEEQKRIKDEQLKEMQRMQELRRDPEAMEQYEAEVFARRIAEQKARKEAEAKLKGEDSIVVGYSGSGLPEGWKSA